ncbi:MAG TPA: alkyl sulfatase dimerization domain-containing protein [Solirubrobacterales bacterium]|jgi:alkyl sulfatase BDS1-like metallo-beta-lactamase superfamily hydrolase|nr:alkyl sulfatase dimerization domain-containing protein [Solirubrobacterales bacterium]
MATDSKQATEITARINREAIDKYAFADTKDFEDIKRGFIAPVPDDGVILNAAGEVVLDMKRFAFIEGDTPDSVNPSLWRQSLLVKEAGLFEVIPDGIYQVRSHDIANVTFIEGDDGVIVMDCGAVEEATRMAKDLYYANRPHEKPIVAVIYTHTHIDHYGGVKGLVTAEEVESGKVPIIAPSDDFDKYALGENVIAGNAMSRRSGYPFGELLPHCATGVVSDGIALTALNNGTVTYISPTDIIRETGEKREIAGLTFEFQMAPDTEAPEEFHFYIPELKALTCAENANHSLHNIQTLRGARTRDAANFARYLDEAIELWGDKAEIHFGPHTWPVWGNEELTYFLRSQRDAYKYIHDQTLRLANHGLTPIEIAETLTLPEQLAKDWWNQNYHGSLNHDVKAVYAKELGWFDGNPANLYPLPPSESAKRYVEAIGGADAVLAVGRKAFEEGDYRWVTELVGKAVFADPGNQEARDLQADAFEQLGYQADAPQWRNIFLSAALELRGGVAPGTTATASADTIAAMPLGLLLDFIAVRLNGPKAAAQDITINLTVTDLDDPWSIQVRNGVLHHWARPSKDAALTLTLPRLALVAVFFQPTSLDAGLEAGHITAEGDIEALRTLLGLLDDFEPNFNLVEPNPIPD